MDNERLAEIVGKARQEYCGDIINLKTYSKSFKLKTRYDNPNKAIHRDMHEPIVDRAAWERIQEKRGNIRKRKTKEGEKIYFPACSFALIVEVTSGITSTRKTMTSDISTVQVIIPAVAFVLQRTISG